MKKLTTDQFIEKAKTLHGDRYDYSLCRYERSGSHVEIICPVHGSFFQVANAHLVGSGCNACGYARCSEKKRESTSRFISKAVAVHGSKYGYGNAVYMGAHKKLTITCFVHGNFDQDAHSHLKGSGCKQCAISAHVRVPIKPKSYFVRKSMIVHGDTYDYSGSIYLGSKNQVEIVCRIHGSFWQCASDHMKGTGCPDCCVHGFKPYEIGYLYVLLSGHSFKIGISNSPKSRIVQLRRSTPFTFEPVYMERSNGYDIAKRERSLHRIFDGAGLCGFDGATEWFKIEPGFMEKIANAC